METDVFSAEDDLQEPPVQEEEFSAGVLEEDELTEGAELEDGEEILSAESEETSDEVVELSEKNFPDENFLYHLKYNFDQDGDGKVNVSDVKELKLEQGSQQIQEMKGIELFTDLEILDFSNNVVESIDLSKNTKLIELNCSNNYLISLDISKNVNLVKLNCLENRLKSLDVSKCANLTKLFCSECDLSSLDVSANTNLESLFCEKNNIDKLNLSNHPQLDMVSCQENCLTDIDVHKSTKLEKIWCCKNNLSNLDLSGNPLLEDLRCCENQLSSLDVSFNPELSCLWCVDNQISSLDFTKNKNLLEAHCDANQISEIKGGENSWITYVNKVQNIQVSPDSTFDLSKIPGMFHIGLATDWEGGTVEKNILTVDRDAEQVTFNYAINVDDDIYKYNIKTKKYEKVFRVKGKTLYRYNAGTKKYTKVNTVKTTSKTITCTLTNLKLKSDGTQKYAVRAAVQKSGYTTKTSALSKAITLK